MCRGRRLCVIPKGYRRDRLDPVWWLSRGLLGCVVPQVAKNSLVHKGEVLSLAELSADGHKRHICVIRINTETLGRKKNMQ